MGKKFVNVVKQVGKKFTLSEKYTPVKMRNQLSIKQGFDYIKVKPLLSKKKHKNKKKKKTTFTMYGLICDLKLLQQFIDIMKIPFMKNLKIKKNKNKNKKKKKNPNMCFLGSISVSNLAQKCLIVQVTNDQSYISQKKVNPPKH